MEAYSKKPVETIQIPDRVIDRHDRSASAEGWAIVRLAGLRPSRRRFGESIDVANKLRPVVRIGTAGKLVML